MKPPFRHGFRIGDLGLPDDGEEGTFVLAIDVLDPVGQKMPVPGKTGSIVFDDPTVGIMLFRALEDDEDVKGRKRPVFMPADLVTRLSEQAETLGALIAAELVGAGADLKAAGRVGLSVASALQGATFRPDYFGVMGWSPHLSLPFGIVRSGPWIREPFAADPIPSRTHRPVRKRRPDAHAAHPVHAA